MNRSGTNWPPYRQPVAVVQPLPGIGDMVWHLPHIRAIATQVGAPVTLLTKPRSLADQLLVSEPAVCNVVWLDLNPAGRRGSHDGAGGFIRLVRTLRAGNFGSILLLHHSVLIAAAASAASIPDRRGYGWGVQRWFLTSGPFLPDDVRRLHQHTRATRYLAAAGVPLGSAEPRLDVPDAVRMTARMRLGDTPGGYVAIGLGSSDVLRQWGAQRFGELATALLDAGWRTLVLLGGMEDAPAATTIFNHLRERGVRVVRALGWNMADVFGLLSGAAFYVGNNTGVMNIAAAIGIRTYALFGTTRPFDHASQIVAITAPDTGVHDGMARLTLARVLDAIHTDRGSLNP